MVPGAPGRGRRPQRADAGRRREPVGPVGAWSSAPCEPPRPPAHRRPPRTPCPSALTTTRSPSHLRPDRRDRPGAPTRRRRRARPRRCPGRRPAAPPPRTRRPAPSARGGSCRPGALADRPERAAVEPVGERRAPRLPAVLVDPGPLRVHGQRCAMDVAGGARQRGRQPLTAPAVMPRTKNRCSERNTMIGTMIVMKPPAVMSSQPWPGAGRAAGRAPR